ncbi:hypothetical protein [Streptacidiphilus monticola]|uniref:Peptidoglycan binding-like domain-containing protein n=1 Tax=Streptacidiphilus monticola TaxID=2161674 RepID=A0ABW1G8P1_9ACTN
MSVNSPQWRLLVDHVQSIPEQVYEHWRPGSGWDNRTRFGREYGWDGVAWCMIFAWDMYHDVGLDAVVPKTASVAVMADWARRHGRWSEYPSVGALTVFGGGVHTEIVTGFDAATVRTKGGNSLRTGAVDNGQGNGVWSHSHARQDPYVTGYLAPRFPDGDCPPTADPSDPRGGRAVGSWLWGPLAPSRPVPIPGPRRPVVSLAHLVAAARTDPGAAQGHTTFPADVRPVEAALRAEGLLAPAYAGDGSFGSRTLTAYAAWQHRCGFAGSDADGIPGRSSLRLLAAKHGFGVRN